MKCLTYRMTHFHKKIKLIKIKQVKLVQFL